MASNSIGAAFRVISVGLISIAAAPVYAEIPAINNQSQIPETGFKWVYSISADEGGQLIRFTAPNQVAEYEISDCMFCDADEDNCDADGIFPVPGTPPEPILAVVCHVGAHSQRLQIFAPLRDADRAILSVTGAYFVALEISERGVAYEYDQYDADGQPVVTSGSWP